LDRHDVTLLLLPLLLPLMLQVILETAVSYPLLMETNPTLEVPRQQQSVQHIQDAASLLDTGNIDGLTALHLAVCRSHAEAVQALLEVCTCMTPRSQV
jgi:hypothetical protein